ncbi:uncharacterized protein PV09_05138 [Verruconis gallopava]|uniref:Fibronectin type-III domain-containing protein n=1 Tax=Verruconis gallopava TaxID=253628 RepID=A0A0D2AXC3_9PEZI|nr:uncharacterized protein PV09_05138 [Verruconis gallopava]KIW03839.1 hypothetical protein PV09_05138 [Verruconis gallopava]
MRSLLSFTIEHFLLFEATLLQYASFVAAVTSPSNLSTSLSVSSCSGCAISATQTLLSFPQSVQEVTSSLSVTVIPYVTVYDDGTSITNYATYTKYKSGQSTQGLATSPAPLTWETFGTTLTYPTTYYAYLGVSAGPNKLSGTICRATPSPAVLDPSDQARLVFPFTSEEGNDVPTKSAQSVLDSLPTISALVSPNAPAQCSHAIGVIEFSSATPVATESGTSAALAAVVHTSVRFLTTQGQAVVTRASGTAPPPQSQVNDNGGSSPSPTNGGQGGNNNQQSTPVINWGGSTITAGPSGVWNIGGHSVTAGGSAQIIDGTTVSIAAGGSVAVINGHTSSLESAKPSSSGGLSQATGGAGGQVSVFVPLATWFAAISIGFLGLLVGVYL